MNIAIVRLSALGDIIQSQTVLQFIKKAFPEAKIDWYCDRAFEDILKRNPHIDNVIPLGIKDLKKNFAFRKLEELVKTLRNSKEYDYIIDLQGLIKSAVVARALGKNTYGFDKNSIREKGAAFLYSNSFSIDYSENVIRRYCTLVAKIFNIEINDEDIVEKEPILHFEKRDTSNYLSKEKRNVVFVLGASWDSKIYPPKKLAVVAQKLDINPILVWGSEKEKGLCDEFLEVNPLATVCKRLDLDELCSLIEATDMTIGADTGPTHIAWAGNKPVITIFGPTPSFRNSFESKISKVVDTGKVIDPRKIDKNDFSIEKIEEEEIIKVANELL